MTDDGKFEDKIFIQLDGLFKSRKGRFVQARVEGIEKDRVVLAGGETLPYAALIIATGNTWRGLLNFPTSACASSSRFDQAWLTSRDYRPGGHRSVCKPLACQVRGG